MRLLLDGQRKLISSLLELAQGDSVLVLEAVNKYGVHDQDGFREAAKFILNEVYDLDEDDAAALVDDVLAHFNISHEPEPARRSGT